MAYWPGFGVTPEGEEITKPCPSLGQGFLIAVAVGRQSCPDRGIGELIQPAGQLVQDPASGAACRGSFHHQPSRYSEASAARLARGVDGDAVSGDWIENGHGQFSLVQAQGKRRAFRLDQVRL
jgi:hypothetical protein